MEPEITISDIRLKQKGDFSPVIVKFLNGDVPEEKLSTVKAKLIPHENVLGKAVKISTPDKQKYVNEPINKLSMKNRFIAIRNRKTNKVRLVEVEFTPLINSLFLKKEGVKEDNRDNHEQFATLQRLFGTKKAVRRLEQREAVNIDRSHIENQINELLQNNPVEETANESLNKTELEIEGECLSILIPPCYRDATNILDVYKVEDCISEEEISSLADAVREIMNKSKKLENYSLFLQTTIPEVLSTSQNLELRLACLLYADALMKYLKINAKNLAKAASTLCPSSQMIGGKIIREFCVKSGTSLNRPIVMKDKAVCHIIVLTLIACNYRIDLEAIAKISSYGYKKMKQLGRIVGVVPAGKATSVHTLVLPLPPPMKMVKKSKRPSKR